MSLDADFRRVIERDDLLEQLRERRALKEERLRFKKVKMRDGLDLVIPHGDCWSQLRRWALYPGRRRKY